MCIPITIEFHGENFLGWLKNHEIRENFLLREFPAIRYYARLTYTDVYNFVPYNVTWSVCYTDVYDHVSGH